MRRDGCSSLPPTRWRCWRPRTRPTRGICRRREPRLRQYHQYMRPVCWRMRADGRGEGLARTAVVSNWVLPSDSSVSIDTLTDNYGCGLRRCGSHQIGRHTDRHCMRVPGRAENTLWHGIAEHDKYSRIHGCKKMDEQHGGTNGDRPSTASCVNSNATRSDHILRFYVHTHITQLQKSMHRCREAATRSRWRTHRVDIFALGDSESYCIMYQYSTGVQPTVLGCRVWLVWYHSLGPASHRRVPYKYFKKFT